MLATKPRKCKAPGCGNKFIPSQSFQKWCCLDCAKALGLALLAKKKKVDAIKEKREDKVKKESLKRRADYIKEAQTAFNRFIRARDAGKPCICCGKPMNAHDSISGHSIDSGHYRSVGSAPHMRFIENNCHAQLVLCNRWGSGRAVDYRIGLIDRIGLEAVEALEADQTPRKYSIEDLQEIKKKYTALANELKRNSLQ